MSILGGHDRVSSRRGDSVRGGDSSAPRRGGLTPSLDRRFLGSWLSRRRAGSGEFAGDVGVRGPREHFRFASELADDDLLAPRCGLSERRRTYGVWPASRCLCLMWPASRCLLEVRRFVPSGDAPRADRPGMSVRVLQHHQTCNANIYSRTRKPGATALARLLSI